MITVDDLQRFCNPDRSRMETPWTFGEWTYATNGKAIIRVPKIAEIGAEESGVSRQSEKLFSKTMEAMAKKHRDWYPLPTDIKIETEPCRSCNGTGKRSVCPECKGTGEVRLDSDYNEYNVSCKSCEGEGKLSERNAKRFAEKYSFDGTVCEHCEGKGFLPSTKTTKIGDAHFRDDLLFLFSSFEKVEICPHGAEDAAYVKFTGGEGLIMPCKVA